MAIAASLNCDYIFYGAPAGNIRLEILNNGTPADHASVSLFQMPAKDAPVTSITPHAGESLNLVLFKDDPQNEIQMKVQTPGPDGSIKSTLINPSMPGMGKEIPGTCKH